MQDSHTHLLEQPSSSPLHGAEAGVVGVPGAFQISLITALVGPFQYAARAFWHVEIHF